MTPKPFQSMRTLAACLAVTMTTSALAANTCDEVYQASIKSSQTPHHVYTASTLSGGKSRAVETIYAGGVEYLKMDGQWRRSVMKPHAMLELTQEKLKTHPDTCVRIGDQAAGGEAVAVYKVHNNEFGTDQVVRIFKSSGLMQGGTVSLPNQSAEMRYEYTNVQAPAGVH